MNFFLDMVENRIIKLRGGANNFEALFIFHKFLKLGPFVIKLKKRYLFKLNKLLKIKLSSLMLKWKRKNSNRLMTDNKKSKNLKG